MRRCVKGIKNGDYTVLKERHKRMCSFTKRWVPAKSVYIDGFCGIMPKKNLSKNYVLGSDQVWNFAFLSKDWDSDSELVFLKAILLSVMLQALVYLRWMMLLNLFFRNICHV